MDAETEIEMSGRTSWPVRGSLGSSAARVAGAVAVPQGWVASKSANLASFAPTSSEGSMTCLRSVEVDPEDRRRDSVGSTASSSLDWLSGRNSDGEDEEDDISRLQSRRHASPTLMLRTPKFLFKSLLQVIHFILQVYILKVYWGFGSYACFICQLIIVVVDTVFSLLITCSDIDIRRWLARIKPYLCRILALPIFIATFGVLQLIHVKRAWARQLRVAEVIGQMQQAEYVWTGPALGAEKSRPIGFFTSTWSALISTWAWLSLGNIGELETWCILANCLSSFAVVSFCVIEADITISNYVAKRYHFNLKRKGGLVGHFQFAFPLFHWLYRLSEVVCQVTLISVFVVYLHQMFKDDTAGLVEGTALFVLRLWIDWAVLLSILRRISMPSERVAVHMLVALFLLLSDVTLFVDMPGFCYPAKRISTCIEIWRLFMTIVSGAIVCYFQFFHGHGWRHDDVGDRWMKAICVLLVSTVLRCVMRCTCFRSNGDDLHSAVTCGRSRRLRKLLEAKDGGEALDVDGKLRDETQQTPSMLAAQINDVASLTVLFSAGASTSERDAQALTVFHYAVRELHLDSIIFLKKQRRAAQVLARELVSLEKLLDEACERHPQRANLRASISQELRPLTGRYSVYGGTKNVRPIAVQARQLNRLFPDAVDAEQPEFQELQSVSALVLAQELGPLAKLLLVPAEANGEADLNLADFRQVRVLGQGSFGSVIEVVENARSGPSRTASSAVAKLVSSSVGQIMSLMKPEKVDKGLGSSYASASSRSASSPPARSLKLGTTPLVGKVHTVPEDASPSSSLGPSSSLDLSRSAQFWQPRRFAMKLQVKSQANSSSRVCSEAIALQRLEHPFIVRLEYAFQTPQFFALVLELCPGGDLNQVLCQRFTADGKRIGLLQPEAARYLGQILLALTYLHSENMVYRDMKPANCLIAEGNLCKLSDFGTVSFVRPRKAGDPKAKRAMTLVGTQGFFAPELVYGDYDSDEEETVEEKAPDYFKTDAYSYGVTLAIALVGDQHGFAELQIGEDSNEALLPAGGSEKEQLASLGGSVKEGHLSQDAYALLSDLLREKPKHRKKLSDVLNHPFFLETLGCDTLEELITPDLLEARSPARRATADC